MHKTVALVLIQMEIKMTRKTMIIGIMLLYVAYLLIGVFGINLLGKSITKSIEDNTSRIECRIDPRKCKEIK